MTNTRVDAHKLILHPQRVAEWLKNEVGGAEKNTIYPINLEIGLSGACNHRCVFCCVDHMQYKPSFLSYEVMKKNLTVLSQKGLKSVLYAGNGEPILNKDFVKIVNMTKCMGIDVALSTNGVLFTPEIASACMESLSWIKFSISAGCEKTYKQIHRGKDGDFERVISNISSAAKIKQKQSCHTTLGVQIVMTPDNADEVFELAKTVKKAGADLFTVKSLGYNELSSNVYKDTFDEEEFYGNQAILETKLSTLCDECFSAVYRSNRINHHLQERQYSQCYAAPFYACIDSDGIVYPCCNMLGVPDMAFGNINESSFDEIWEGEQRKMVMEGLAKENLKRCPKDCRLANMNIYLHELKNPGEHVNFI